MTGGGGFLGSRIAKRLLQRGDEVAILGRRKYPRMDANIECFQTDIRDRQAVFDALRGCHTVFHTAALPGIWGEPDEFYGINVTGTQNVIDGCLEHSVKKLVFTSSPSVVFDDTDLENVDEDTPYPESYSCVYPRTKAIAERLVRKANGNVGLSTVSLRPHLIWGEGDPHLVPRILDRARKGRLVRVGSGKNRVDIIYIANAVEAHILACDALERGSPVAGNCYFISDGKPVVLWDWIGQVLCRLGRPPVTRSMSYRSARVLGAFLEMMYRALAIRREPPMTRFVAAQLATSHYFNISRARTDFGYAPVVSQEEGMQNLIRYFQARPEG